MGLTQQDLIAAYVEGVDTIAAYAERFTPEQWAGATPCKGWTALDLAAHVRTVAARYHAFLDAGLAGERRLLVPLGQMDQINAEDMRALPADSGPTHINEFVRLARLYVDRVEVSWDTPIGILDGYVAAGLALGVQAVEVNVHAWDFAKVLDEDFRPEGAQVMFDAAARAFVLTKTNRGQRAAGWLQTAIHPVVRRVSGDPWPALLKRLGRTP